MSKRPNPIALLFIALCVPAVGQAEIEPSKIALQIEKKLTKSRYMEMNCENVEVSGWEGFATKRCNYEITDKKTGNQKKGLVILLNPTALQLSNWSINACLNVRPQEPRSECVERVISRIINQSGGQFPISGIVYEDLIPKDGIQESYGFRNGVTVRLAGLAHRDTAPLSPDQLKASLTADVVSTVSEEAPARIIGITRAQYHAANSEANVKGLNWISVVKEQYKLAMKSDRNHLIESWLHSAPR